MTGISGYLLDSTSDQHGARLLAGRDANVHRVTSPDASAARVDAPIDAPGARIDLPIDAPGHAPGAAPIDPDAYRQVVGRFATGVTVVTTSQDGVDHAMTANAFTSVSLDPLIVLVCVEKEARFHDAIVASGRWGVSVLDASARTASQWFATRGRPLHGQLDRFPHHRGSRTGAALLDASIATVECATRVVYDGGDHSIVLGDVLSLGMPLADGRPLIYYRGRYHKLA